ncbi:phage tail protein [Shewanella sp. D64]|uniref:phage tail-collar fiber domain-containing protein n=1 Tax=unclassified Shewanella TaxID=196818 RepID=UPI0022BA3F52|nr:MULTISPECIES: phage tail protein [unclassified Shewanella]MEC4728855.1 phage tail protein [Shewanella sp. D64]MEC4740729.1 phage tail protein [Shewanella sp. E94]WBJ95312.1 phage tail protein [Shewanella sp. MTB7]
MSQTILTNAFSAYKAQCEAYGVPIIMDEFIFALVPGQDPDAPIDLNEELPPDAQIVGRFPVTQKGMINPNAVVYSIILGTDVGTWDFNWVGLVNSEKNFVGSISHVNQQTKTAADISNGIEGDTLTRNIITPYTNASVLTQIHVTADVWQLDFTRRLIAMDERPRLENMDVYGDASFMGDGWKAEPNSGTLTIKPGTGYLKGLRCCNELEQVVDLAGVPLPKMLFLVARFEGGLNSEWRVKTALQLADSLPESELINGVTYYAHPIARVNTLVDIVDLRPATWREVHGDENSDPHPQYNLNDATEGELGGIIIASQAEVDAAMNSSKAVTPKTLNKPGILAAARAYADKIKADIYGGVPSATLDTIKEVADALTQTGSAVQSVFTKLAQLTTRVDGNENNIDNHKASSDAHTPAQVGLRWVHNWGASSEVDDASTSTYATTKGVKKAYDKAVAAYKKAGEITATGYHDVSTSRNVGVTYNNDNRVRVVSVFSGPVSSDPYLNAYVNDVHVAHSRDDGTGGVSVGIYFLVQPNATYKVEGNKNKWFEMDFG